MERPGGFLRVLLSQVVIFPQVGAVEDHQRDDRAGEAGPKLRPATSAATNSNLKGLPGSGSTLTKPLAWVAASRTVLAVKRDASARARSARGVWRILRGHGQ